MKKGLLQPLLIWGAFTAVYWFFLRDRLPGRADGWAAIIAGFLMYAAIVQLQAAWTWAGRAQKMGGPSVMSERPADGEVVTVTGPIRATGPLLTAPFSGKPAVLYSSDVKEMRRQGKSRVPVSLFSGIALTPSVIDSPTGTIRLLGFPLHARDDAQRIDGVAERQNAANWVASTPFQDVTGFQVGTMLREMKEVRADDDGQVQKAWRFSNLSAVDGKLLYEYAVEPDEPVCVVGRYSAAKNGIVPDVGVDAVQILRGDREAVRRKMWLKAAGGVAAFLLFVALTNGALYAIVTLRR